MLNGFQKEMRIAEEDIIKFRGNNIPKEDIEDYITYYNNVSYLTIEQAGKELNLKPGTIRSYIKSSILPNAFKHFTNKWFIPKEDIDKLKAKNKIPRIIFLLKRQQKEFPNTPIL